jgi:uncharacterized protein (DUF169 family)
MEIQDVKERYQYDPAKLSEYTEELIRQMHLRATPTALKLYEDKEEMKKVPKIRIPKEGEVYTACQLIGQTTRLNFTVGFTNEFMPTIQCSGVCGFIDAEDYRHSTHLAGAWFEKPEESAKHQESMYALNKRYEAIASSPMISGRLGDPDVCLIYGTPEQIMYMCCALQYNDYEVVESTFVGETSCTDSWVRAFVTQKPCYTMPCFGERRYGGVWSDEMVLAFPPAYIVKILDGIKKLSKNGMRYPATQYGIQQDVRAGMSVSYDINKLKK